MVYEAPWVLAIGATVSLAGCTGLLGDDENGRLDLTVQNGRDDPITVQVTVEQEDGAEYFDESDQIDSGVARAFEVDVGVDGRHEVTVSGDDWAGALAWNASTCARFDGSVGVTAERVDVAGECGQSR